MSDCPKCKRPFNDGNSPNAAECNGTDDDEGVCEAYSKIAQLEMEVRALHRERDEYRESAREAIKSAQRMVNAAAEVNEDLERRHDALEGEIARLTAALAAALAEVEEVGEPSKEPFPEMPLKGSSL